MAEAGGSSTKHYILHESDVVFEDNHLLVVHKKSGIPVQGDETGDTPLTQMVEDFLRIKYNKPGNIYVGLIHRLDRPVEGLVLFAKTSKAAARLSEMFRERQISKIYYAIVERKPPQAAGRLEDYLLKDKKENKVSCSKKETPESKLAILTYRTLEEVNKLWLLEVNPQTGRPHQIRTQLANMGCPILGDTKYGSRQLKSERYTCLLARKLEFIHPVKKEKIVLYSKLPEGKAWQQFDIEVYS